MSDRERIANIIGEAAEQCKDEDGISRQEELDFADEVMDINLARRDLDARDLEKKEKEMQLQQFIAALAFATSTVCLSGLVGFGFALGVRLAGGF